MPDGEPSYVAKPRPVLPSGRIPARAGPLFHAVAEAEWTCTAGVHPRVMYVAAGDGSAKAAGAQPLPAGQVMPGLDLGAASRGHHGANRGALVVAVLQSEPATGHEMGRTAGDDLGERAEAAPARTPQRASRLGRADAQRL